MVDSSTTQASKQTEIVKRLAEENKILKAEIATLKKKQVNSQQQGHLTDDEASTSAGAKKKSRKVGRPRMDDHSASDDELIHHNRTSNSIGKKKAARQANNYEFSEGEDVAVEYQNPRIKKPDAATTWKPHLHNQQKQSNQYQPPQYQQQIPQ